MFRCTIGISHTRTIGRSDTVDNSRTNGVIAAIAVPDVSIIGFILAVSASLSILERSNVTLRPLKHYSFFLKMTLWSRSSGSSIRCIVSSYVCINRYILCCTVGVFSVDTLPQNVIFFRFFPLLLLLLDDDDIDGEEEQEEEIDNGAVIVAGVVEVAGVCSKAKSVFINDPPFLELGLRRRCLFFLTVLAIVLRELSCIDFRDCLLFDEVVFACG